MARLFTNRIRIHDITRHDADLKSHFRWETFGAVMYKLGGIFFVVGSILFFPSFSTYSWLGQTLFFAGSLCYLTINCHDTYDTHRYWANQVTQSREKWLEYSASYIYLIGTLMYIAGRVTAFIDSQYQALSSALFIIGSLLFVVGATINIINIGKISSRPIAQLMNLTAITFIVGSVLFAVGSVPLLWQEETMANSPLLANFISWQFLIGSLLFFSGGVFNYWRAYLFIQDAVASQQKVPALGPSL